MIKKYSLFLALLSVLSVPAFAQVPGEAPVEEESEGPGLSVDITGEVVSNYVWRGYDVFSSYADQKGVKQGSNTGAWAFQPDVTISFPVEGLFLDIWGSFALQGREDVDSDGLFQYSPGGSDILISSGALTKNGLDANAVSLIQADMETQMAAMNSNGIDAYFSEYAYKGGTPGNYKEENGLKRVDEVDFVIGYGAESSLGYFETGLLYYMYPNMTGGASGADKEVYVTWGLPVLEGASLSAYFNVDDGSTGSEQYYQAAYEKGIELADDMTLDLGVNTAYKVSAGKQGWSDAGASVGVSMGGFSIGLNVVRRLDRKWFDDDAAPGALPVYLEGGSTNTDGLIADPSRTGQLDQLVAAEITNEVNTALAAAGSPFAYTYTYRQEVPLTLYYLSASYTVTVE